MHLHNIKQNFYLEISSLALREKYQPLDVMVFITRQENHEKCSKGHENAWCPSADQHF